MKLVIFIFLKIKLTLKYSMSPDQIKDIARKRIFSIRDSIVKNNFQTTDPKEKDYHFELDVLSGNEKVKVLVYFGKKGVKIVFQGNTKSVLSQEVEEISTGKMAFDFPKEQFNEPEEYIGSDETGKGDVFGPLVTCAFYVNKELAEKLRKFGVRDSKDLSENQIIKIAVQIKKLGEDNYEIISINPQRYNELYKKFNNINMLLNWSHSKAIENLLEKKPAKTIITDKFRKKDLIFSNNFDNSNYNIVQETKAEKYIAVAAASILARDKQLRWFAYQKKNGFALKRGASEEVKNDVKNLIKNNGREIIKQFAKEHFKTVKNLL